jgi:hypothetical protein
MSPAVISVRFSRLLAIAAIACLLLVGSFANAAAEEGSDKAIRRDSPAVESVSAEVGLGDLYAVIVGVSQYRDARISRLNVSHKDARDFAVKRATIKVRPVKKVLLEQGVGQRLGNRRVSAPGPRPSCRFRGAELW